MCGFNYAYPKDSDAYWVAFVNILTLEFVLAASFCGIHFVHQLKDVQIVWALISHKDQGEVIQEFQKQVPWVISHMENFWQV